MWQKTVQCPLPVSQIGALKFVTPQWSTPEMSRMTAFLRFPRAAACPSYSCRFTCTITAKYKTVVTSGLENRLLKTPWFEDDEGLRLRTIRRWLRCVFFFLFGRLITAHDSYQSRRRSMVLLRSISPTPEVDQVFILVFDVPSPKCFAQPGDRHSCQGSNTGSLENKKENFQKLLVVVVGVRKKMPGDGAEFSKRPPRHRRNQKPQSLKVWRQIFQKRGKQKNSSKRSYLWKEKR